MKRITLEKVRAYTEVFKMFAWWWGAWTLLGTFYYMTFQAMGVV